MDNKENLMLNKTEFDVIVIDDKYALEENPTYKDNDIRKLQNTDEANAERTFNPLVLRILNNIKAVFKATNEKCNPNLLINSDFSVWQRGENFDTRGYTADRWFNASGNSVINVKKLSTHGVRVTVKSITGATAASNFAQFFENPQEYAGKTVALSISYRSTSQFRVAHIGWRVGNKSYFEIVPIINDGGLYTVYVTKTLPENITWLECGVGRSRYLTASDVDSYIELYTAKLELGSVATPYIPPDPAVNLMQCKRYYKKTEIQQMIAIADTHHQLSFFPVDTLPMRIQSPTIQLNTPLKAIPVNGDSPIDLSDTRLTTSTFSTTGYTTDNRLAIGQMYVLNNVGPPGESNFVSHFSIVEFDAEIY